MENLRIKWPLGISVRNGRNILNGILKILDGRWCGGGGLHLSGSGEGQVVDSYEPSDSRNAENGLAIDNISVPQGN